MGFVSLTESRSTHSWRVKRPCEMLLGLDCFAPSEHQAVSLCGFSFFIMTYGLEPGAFNSFESNSLRCRVNRWLPREYFWSNRIRRIAFRSWFNWLWRSISGKGLWIDQRNNSLVAAVKKRPGRCKYQPHQNVWG